MWKHLLRSVREYKTPSILTLLFIVLEAVIETFIPFITAELINNIKKGVEMEELIQKGIVLVAMAVVSLCC